MDLFIIKILGLNLLLSTIILGGLAYTNKPENITKHFREVAFISISVLSTFLSTQNLKNSKENEDK